MKFMSKKDEVGSIDVKELKYEKGKLHLIYLLIISFVFVIVSISASLGTCDVFADQISMASTISSIILSSIAIFMSISGENKNSYTQNKIIDTAEKISDVSVKVENISIDITKTLGDRLEELSQIKEELKEVRGNVDDVKKQFQQSFSIIGIKEPETNSSNENVILKTYKTIIDRMKKEEQRQLLAYMLEYIVIIFMHFEGDKLISRKEMFGYLDVVLKKINIKMRDEVWIVIVVMNCMGVNEEHPEICQQILDEIRLTYPENHEEKIIEIHSECIDKRVSV